LVLAVASLDTGVFRAQYLATAGIVNGPWRASGGLRLFGGGGTSIASPTLRASFTSERLSVSAFADGTSIDSIAHSDVIAEVRPLSFVAFLGSAGRTTETEGDKKFEASYLKAQAGLRIKKLWFLGGMIRRDSVRVPAPRIFDTLFVVRTEPRATGYTAAIRGQVWRLLHADVSAVRWNDTTGFYRPRYQTRSELFLHTSLLDKLPSGNFGLTASLVHEYRSGVSFPTADGSVRTTTGYRTISTLLEIRVLQATVTWQFRNFLGERYSQVPSFIMPRQTNFYGVRWYFVD